MKIFALVSILVFSTVILSAQDIPKELDRLEAKIIKLFEEKKYSDAEIEAKKALKLAEQEYGNNSIDLQNYIQMLDSIYYVQKKYSLAEPLFKKDYEILKEYLGEDHIETVIAMNNLALLYKEMKKYPEAEETLLEQLNIVVRDHENSYEHVVVLQNLIDLYSITGNSQKKKEYEAKLKLVEKEK